MIFKDFYDLEYRRTPVESLPVIFASISFSSLKSLHYVCHFFIQEIYIRMLDSVGWLPLAIIGALIYGSYSLMLMMVHDKIKKDKIAQVGYSLILSMCFGLLITPIYFLYFNVHHKEKANIILKYIDWKIVLALLVIGLSSGPLHLLVLNAGGSIGQQTMMSLSIIPVLVGSWLFFGQTLNIKQLIGLILAGIGAFLMGSK